MTGVCGQCVQIQHDKISLFLGLALNQGLDIGESPAVRGLPVRRICDLLERRQCIGVECIDGLTQNGERTFTRVVLTEQEINPRGRISKFRITRSQDLSPEFVTTACLGGGCFVDEFACTTIVCIVSAFTSVNSIPIPCI